MGDRSAPPGTRLRERAASPARLWLADVMGGDQTAVTAAADDESRFAGVTHLGVDEHIWHHVSTRPVEAGGRGPKELTGMVDLTPRCPGSYQGQAA